jgi:hypothetical protein
MMKRSVISILALAFCLSSPVGALTIEWINEYLDEAPSDGIIPDDKGFIDLLTAQGFTVNVRSSSAEPVYWTTLDDTKVSYLNAADLVIVSRCLNSGGYATDATEYARWNGVTKPVLLMTGTLSRNNRWRWMNSSGTVETAGAALMLEAVVPSHPVFTGVALTSNQVDILNETVTIPGNNGNITLINTTDVGNGTLIAKSVTATNYAWIVEWNQGQYFYGAAGQIAGGQRMLFSAGASTQTSGFGGQYNLTTEGEKMFINAVDYMIPEPTTMAMLGLGGLAIARIRRKA